MPVFRDFHDFRSVETKEERKKQQNKGRKKKDYKSGTK